MIFINLCNIYIINNNYKDFNYNQDFIPQNNIFNLNTDRFVGVGNINPAHNFVVQGNTFINSTLLINNNNNFSYIYNNTVNNQLKNNNLSLLNVNNKGMILYSNIVSTQNTGVKWTVTNNNNIILTLRDINDNSKLDYKSDLFSITNSNPHTIRINVINNIIIKYILILDNNENLSTNNLDNVYIKINNKYIYIKKNIDGLYELTNYIKLVYNNQYNIEIYNLLNKKCQFLGNYEYQAGSMWKIINDDIFINHNIGIFNNNPKSAIDIKGNSYFSNNLVVNKNIKSNILHSNILHSSNIFTDNIEGINELSINPDKRTVNINSSKNNNILNIGNNFNIKNNNCESINIYTNNLNRTSNQININQINIDFNLKKTNLNNIVIDSTKEINIKNKLVINSLNDNIDDKYKLYIDGDMLINGNLNIE